RFLVARRQSDPNCRVRGIEPAALDVLARHSWPGNIRELRNVIERASVLGNGDFVRREAIEFAPVPTGDPRPAPAPFTAPTPAVPVVGSGAPAPADGAAASLHPAGPASPPASTPPPT